MLREVVLAGDPVAPGRPDVPQWAGAAVQIPAGQGSLKRRNHEGVSILGLYDRTKKADPTPREQANWERLAAAERERQRLKREEEAKSRKGADQAAKQRMLEQFRR